MAILKMYKLLKNEIFNPETETERKKLNNTYIFWSALALVVVVLLVVVAKLLPKPPAG